MKSLDRAPVARAAMAAFCRRRARTALVLTICTVGSLAAASGSALAAGPASPVTAGSRYLALGDSVTFGYEESTVVPAPNYNNAASFPGYPEQLGAELHLNVANASCPGETSSSLVDASAQSNGCENSPSKTGASYRKLHPLHVSYKGSQLAYALSYLKSHGNVRLVSLMIGANDYFVCQATTTDQCASSAEQKAVLAKVSANVRKILSAIRNKAHYRGQLAIVNYYSLDYSVAATNALSALLNTTMDTAAKPFHVVVADGLGELKAAALHSGGHTCAAGLLTQLGTPGKCGIHPSYAGQALLAQALEKVIRLR
jgi:lysophospholipase L1-like esterase